jgi:MFS transporter, AAHS family, 4-hydroxybenzoate transporter
VSKENAIDVGMAIETQSGGSFSRLILILCCAAMVIEGYDVQVLAYAAPAIIRDWQIEQAYFGPVFGAALFGYLLGATLLSGVSDKIGRKKVIVLGNIFFGLLTVASAFARNIEFLLALRFLAGLGLGASIPSSIALAVEYAPELHRSFRVSILFVGYTLGGALGGILTAPLIVNFGWQSAFLADGFASLAVAVLLFFMLPESARFLAVLGGRERELASIMRRLRPDLAVDASSRFTVAEHGAEPGMPVKYLFTDGRALITSLLWTAFITSLMGHYFLTSWLPTVLNSNGVPLGHAVVAGSLIQGGGALGSLIVGRLMDRLGMIAIVTAFMISIPFVVLIGAFGMPEYLLMLVIFISGMSLLGGQVGLNALAGTIYPTFVRSSGAGLALGIGRVGSILGPIIGGLLIGMKLSMPALFICAALPAACCALAVLGLRTVVLARRMARESSQIRLTKSAGRSCRSDSGGCLSNCGPPIGFGVAPRNSHQAAKNGVTESGCKG